MPPCPLSPSVGRFFLLPVLALAANAPAQNVPAPAAGERVRLPDYIVSASRTPQDPAELGSAAMPITADDLAARQIRSLRDALGLAAAPVAAGGAGAASSLFLRGANSNQTLFLVDGIRLNDANTDYQVYLGGAAVSACDRLEITLGPQSTLYGGEAVGGVIAVRAQRGAGAPGARVGLEAGSFGTVRGSLAAQGAREAWSYNLSLNGEHTDNARPNNSFDSATTVLRLDRTLGERLSIGGTWRWFHSVFASPGDIFTNDPNNEDREDNGLGTLFAEFKASDDFASHLTLGLQDRRFVSDNPVPNPPYDSAAEKTLVHNQRAVFDWQNTIALGGGHRLTAGLTAERNHTTNDGFGAIDRRQSLLAFFVDDEWRVARTVFLSGGLRSDDFDTFGRATTGRATAAWQVVPDRLKLRASYGTAFRSPSFLDLYGTSAFYAGNPHLQPEHARGWDAGLDDYLPDHRGTLSATWFQTSYRDLIVYDFASFPSTTVNVDRARTRGLELSAQVAGPAGWSHQFRYTYLEAENLTQHTTLLRRPRHALHFDCLYEFNRDVSVGAGLTGVARRKDVDAQTFATIDGKDYAVARVYGAWRVTPQLTLQARLENLLDQSYEEASGYPMPGRGAYAGAEWRF